MSNHKNVCTNCYRYLNNWKVILSYISVIFLYYYEVNNFKHIESSIRFYIIRNYHAVKHT